MISFGDDTLRLVFFEVSRRERHMEARSINIFVLKALFSLHIVCVCVYFFVNARFSICSLTPQGAHSRTTFGNTAIFIHIY